MGKSFRIILVVFLVFCFLFGQNYYVRGISLRVISTVISTVLVFFNWRQIKLDNVLFLYIIYVIWYIIISFCNGEINDEYFFKLLANWHFPCILLYVLIPSYVNESIQVKQICYFVVAFLVFDVLLSLAQFAGIPAAWEIGNYINAYAAKNNELFLEQYDATFGYLGISVINGMCASVVDNGYLIATFFPLLFILFNTKYNKIFPRISVLILITITLLASAAIQQRMGFYLIILFLIFHVSISFKGIGRVFLIPIGVLFIVLAEYMLTNLNIGRLSSFVDLDRATAYKNSISMILNDSRLFWFGGEDFYRLYFDHTPHNTLIGAWVYSGVGGFCIYMMLLFVILKRIVPSLFVYRNNTVKYTLAVACCIFIAYSMTHSAGIHNGKALFFWLLFGLYNKS